MEDCCKRAPWAVPVEACTTLTNTNSDPACVKVCLDGADGGALDVNITNFDDMPLGIEASFAPLGCTFTDDDVSGKVFLCKVIDEETQVISYEPKYVAFGSSAVADYDPTIHGAWGSCDLEEPQSIELGCLWLGDLYNGKVTVTSDGALIFFGLDGTIEDYSAVDHGVIGGCPVEVDFPDQIYTTAFEKCYTTPGGAVTVKGVEVKGACIATCDLAASVTCTSDANNPIGTEITEIPNDWVQVACDDCITDEDTECVECE